MVEEKKKEKIVKYFAGLLTVFLIVVFVLAILSIVAWIIFWAFIIAIGIYAFKVLPKMKK